MKESSYRERDYAFGQLMLTLRTKLKLTQIELAEMLGVRRRAVIDWEGGLTWIGATHSPRRASMDERGNWTCSRSGWCRSAVAW